MGLEEHKEPAPRITGAGGREVFDYPAAGAPVIFKKFAPDALPPGCLQFNMSGGGRRKTYTERSKKEFPISKYVCIKIIGRGAFGTVYRYFAMSHK